MPFNGTGLFVPIGFPDYPAVSGELIKASAFNLSIADLHSGLTNAVTRDGQSPPTQNLPMATRKHTGVGPAVNDTDYAQYGQVKASAVQSLTNKTIDLADNTLTGTLAEFNSACSDADFASTSALTSALTDFAVDLADTVDLLKGVTLVGGAGRVVTSIADLRALPVAGASKAFVLGYYTSGDGGGGAYWYDSTDAVSADNGGTIIVATDGGRWKFAGKDFTIQTFGAKCDGVTDDSAAVQLAVDYCATFAQWPALIVPGKTLLSSSINIDRLVDTTTSEFRIIGQGAGAGFYVTTAIPMFTSTIAVTTDPKSEHVAFEGIQFECNNAALAAYVLSEKFLRVRFDKCFFQAIKCLDASIYAQDFRFVGCKARAWESQFFQSHGAFYIVSSASAYEFGADAFYLGDPANTVGVVGCSFHNNLFENSGTFITAGIVMGMSVQGNYFEYNATPALSFNYSLKNNGINVSGNFFTTLPANLGAAYFEIAWGDTVAASVGGNHCVGRLHDTTGLTVPVFDAKDDYASVQLVRGGRKYTLAGNGFVQIASVALAIGEAHRVKAWTASSGAGNVVVYQEYIVSRAAGGSVNVATVADVAAGGYGVLITTGAGVYGVQNKAVMPNTYQPYISVEKL